MKWERGEQASRDTRSLAIQYTIWGGARNDKKRDMTEDTYEAVAEGADPLGDLVEMDVLVLPVPLDHSQSHFAR